VDNITQEKAIYEEKDDVSRSIAVNLGISFTQAMQPNIEGEPKEVNIESDEAQV